jgi:hypothetical protein
VVQVLLNPQVTLIAVPGRSAAAIGKPNAEHKDFISAAAAALNDDIQSADPRRKKGRRRQAEREYIRRHREHRRWRFNTTLLGELQGTHRYAALPF